MFSLVSTYIFIVIGLKVTAAAENGYVVIDFVETTPPCKDASKVIPSDDMCAGVVSYKVPDSSGYSSAPDLSSIKSLINTTAGYLKTLGANEKCTEAFKKYFCELSNPFRCDDDFIKVDGKDLAATCDEAERECPANLSLNCSSVAKNPALQQSIPRKLTCVPFPELKNDPYSCEGNYKVAAMNKTSVQISADMIVSLHNSVKNAKLSDAECEKKVADVMCKARLIACSHDRTKLVSLLSKQECYKNVGCVNKTNNANLIQKSQELCSGFPDETKAKKYSLDNVYVNNKATNNNKPTNNNKATSIDLPFSAILFLATFIAQRFF